MKLFFLAIVGCIFIFSGQLLAHEGEKHTIATLTKNQLSRINQRYLKEIKPIFEKKCFDCHGSGKKLPWYAAIPGPKQLIQWDIDNAQKHFNMTQDFPFAGHGNPVEDLQAIVKSTQEDTMPPLRFLLLNWEKKLNDHEEKLILNWAKGSLKSTQETQ